MAKKVALKDIVEALEMTNEHIDAYLDRESGDILYVTEDDRFAMEFPEDTPEWQEEHIAKLQDTVDTDRLLQLPDAFEIHMWSIMESFCRSVDDEDVRDEMFEAIHGKGAFRWFQHNLNRFGLREQWYKFRDEALEEIARGWLEENEIPFE